MSNCFSCGGQFSTDVNALLRAYKEQYERLGVIRYFYRTETNGAILICTQSSFNFIYENHIQPNLQKGAEYAHIKEFS